MIAPSIPTRSSEPNKPKTADDARCHDELQLGEWTFSPDRHQICQGAQSVHLEPQLAKLLLFLVQGDGRVLSKDEIIDGVWATPFVADSALTRAMAELRRALGDDAHHPRFIETIPKRGYRWLPQVEPPHVATELLPSAPMPRRRRRAALPWPRGVLLGCGLFAVVVTGGYSSYERLSPVVPAAVQDLRIAVLPFDNLLGDSDQDYFANGMTEALTTNLARVDTLSVISRRSVEFLSAQGRSAGEIAHALEVDAIVEGSVLRSEGRVRFTVQLTDADSDAHIWAQIYERPMSDVLALQSEIARTIASEIRDTLSGPPEVQGGPAVAKAEPPNGDRPADRPVDPQAYELFLKGRQHLGRCDHEGPNETASYFQQALAIDPTYAPAYAGLAHYYTRLAVYGYLNLDEALPLARAAAERAIELDETVAEAHLATALVRFTFDWDWQGAEQAFLRALELSPGDAWVQERYAFFLTCLGRFEDAIAAGRRAVELDPLNSTTRLSLAWVYLNARDHHRSLAELQTITDLGLEDTGNVYESWNYALMGRYSQAIEAVEDIRRQTGAKELGNLGVLAWMKARAGQTSEAHELLWQMQEAAHSGEPQDPYNLAIAYTGLEENDLAFEALDDAFAVRSPNLVYLRVEPFFETLRFDPRYQRLQEKAGLD